MQELWALILDYARSMWRFRWYALGAAWAVAIAGWAWTVTQSDVYEAGARVYVDTSSQLRQLLGNQIIEPDVQEQLNQVRQSMLGRVQLEEVARKADLDLRVTSPEGMNQVISQLRSSISISSAGGGRRGPDNLYSITYRHPDRNKAVEVVDTLLNTFVGNTLEAKRGSSEEARTFLTQQIQEYEKRLQAAEERLAEFNKRNYDRLPGSQGGYFQRLQAESTALEEARKELRQAQSRRDRIQQQLRGESPTTGGTGDADMPGPLADLDARIQRMETQLDELLLRYTEQHPDVISTRETLERLRAQRLQEMTETQAIGASGQAVASNNPVYQSLQIALNETEVEIATLSENVRDREQRVAELQAAIDEIPDVEAELARLNRDYNVTQTQYQNLLQSLEREKLSRDAQNTGQVSFRVIDPPVAGSQPVAPNRGILVVMSTMAGLAAGVGVAFLLAQMMPVFHSAANLYNALEVPVLGSVGIVWQGHLKRDGSGYLTFALASSTLLLAFGGVLAVELVGPGFRNL